MKLSPRRASLFSRLALAGVLLLWLFGGALLSPAQAATAYNFPGNLPGGCSASNSSYTCGPLTLSPGDTLTFGSPGPSTLTINGDLDASSAQINAAGNVGDLNLVVSGTLSAGSGAMLNASVTAGSVTNVAGSAVFKGSVTTTAAGNIQLGDNSRVSGSVISNSGVIFVNNNATVDGRISTSAAITVGDFSQVGSDITSTTGAVTVGDNSRATGAISAGGAVTVGANSAVIDVTSTGGAVTVGADSTATGAIRGSGAVTVGARAKVQAVTSTGGALTIGANANVSGNIVASGAITVGADATVSAKITGDAAITLGANSRITHCVRATTSAALTLGSGAVVHSVCCGAGACDYSCLANSSTLPAPQLCGAEPAGPDHLEVRHVSGNGLTCSPSTLTVVACQNANCSTRYTDGVTGTLTASGTGMTVNWPGGAGFSIPAGSSSVTRDFQVTTAGRVVLGMSGASPAPVTGASCNFGSPSCTFTAADAGFIFNVPNHVSGVGQAVSVSAVRKSDNSAACVPAFTGNRSVTFSCAYLNPASGNVPVQVGGTAAACGASGVAVSLAFNATGTASTSVQYGDAGQVRLDARYAGSGSDAGLVMTGSDNFIAAPASFGFSALPAGPIKAGSAFGATVTAFSSTGSVTPNFGAETSPESATLAFTRAQPTGIGASNGVFAGSLGGFSAGTVSTNNLVWSEVGQGDLSATLTSANYLGSGLNITGTTGSAGAIGRFIPNHFDVVVTPACGIFSYAAQPFSVRITARNGLIPAGTTLNYDGTSSSTPNFAKAVTLSDAPTLGLGSFTGTGIAASLFSAGVATTSAPAYSFTTKLTAEKSLTVRAIDTDAVSSAGHAEGSTPLRSGRLRLSNAFGSEKSPLLLSVQTQYWSASTWVLNSADSCSVLPAVAVVLSSYLDNKGAALTPATAWSTTAVAFALSNGRATLVLSAPSPTLTGSVDLALNLGSTATDKSCLATHPPSTGGGVPWLRSQNGGCSTTWDRDPSARATFGIYSPESRKTLHVRELF